MTSADNLKPLVDLRHRLHEYPELSGQEKKTASLMAKKLKELVPDELITGIGGYGVAARFNSANPGPCVLFRAELDALPIEEINDFPHRSKNSGISHKCGHDGHMSIIYGLAQMISNERPKQGSVILLFQPAEETGEGARAVVADPKYSMLKPDYCYALHNLPGHPLAEVLIRSGTFNCASRGMIVNLSGKTAHAAYPETGVSPALALAELLQVFPGLASTVNKNELLMTTTVHATMGERAFGTAPADAEFMVTLRSETNEGMDLLVAKATEQIKKTAADYGLKYEIGWTDIFDASINDLECVENVARAAKNTAHTVCWLPEAFRWSEDFGAISASAKGAMFAYGAGEQRPQIHNPDYDFPDDLINSGMSIFFDLYKQHLL
ncbi:MAG: amidohydrolase [Kordiimonadaceae bacterium]|nr:amidohydrolase [Kordiimonadaceae bacterium]